MIKTLLGSMAVGLTLAALLFLGATLAERTLGLGSALERSIVLVLNAEATGGGTGWVTTTSSGTRVIVTNDHVCQVERDGSVRIQDDTGKTSIKPILRRSFERDLCVIEGVDAPTLRVGSEGPARFERVAVMGHPFLNPTTPQTGQYIGDNIVPIGMSPEKDGTCKPGTITERSFFGTFCILSMELSFSTVPVYPGNSGSPVVNSRGEVIGVMNSASNRDNNGMFIPLPYVKQILTD